MFNAIRLFVVIFFVSRHTMAKDNCKFRDSLDQCVSISFVEEISRRKDSKFILKVLKPNGDNITLSLNDLNIELWMEMKSGHGHGSDKVLVKKNKNNFNISNVWLLMIGEWQIKLTYTMQGKKVTATVPVCVGRKAKDSHMGHCSK